VWGLAFAAVIPPLLLGVGAFTAWFQYYRPGLLLPIALTALFVVSIPAAYLFFLRRRKPLRKLKLGWQGERAVGDALKLLERRGYHVFHDLQFDRFNIDHVVVGPGGVFAVETKTRSKRDKHGGSATVTWRDGELRIDGVKPERDHVGQAKSEAAEVGNLLRRAGQDIWVRAVLLYPGWFVEADDPETPDQVFVANESYFAKFVTDRERILSNEQINAAVAVLDRESRR